jgi:hypothetical protein
MVSYKVSIIDHPIEPITPETTRFLIAISRLIQGIANSVISGEDVADERLLKILKKIKTYATEILVPVSTSGYTL